MHSQSLNQPKTKEVLSIMALDLELDNEQGNIAQLNVVGSRRRRRERSEPYG